MDYSIDYFNGFITNSKLYYAHLSEGRNSELLSEHSALVYDYAKLLVDKQQLNSIILNLIDNTIPKHLSNKQLLAKCIETLFWQAIAFHDLGKVNKLFQQKRMKNNAQQLLSVTHSFESKHSVIGMYIFLANFWKEFLKLKLSDEEQIFLCNVALYMSYAIYMHHSPFLLKAQNNEQHNWDVSDISDKEYFWVHANVKISDIFELKPFLSLFKIDLNEEQIEQFHICFLRKTDFRDLFDHYNVIVSKEENAFPLFSLIKLNYSLLTASDYLATAHYMNGWTEKVNDFGLIDSTLKNKIIKNIEESKNYNQRTYKAINNGVEIHPDGFKNQSNENLNYLRQCIAMEVIKNSRDNTDKKLFYIEAPTGGGKTNASMLALAEFLRADNNNQINKVFYVFPFTTLITQTYQSLSETLGLDDSEIAEIHSKAPYHTGRYEEDYKNYLDDLLMNYPITLLSHIKFFDVLKTNHKEDNYLLQRMANSVVIIDEIQSYSPKIWDKIVYFVVNYAKYFNMKFIIMSATLPKIGDIIDNKELATNFVYLIKDKNKYFQNPNFCSRVQFDYSLLKLYKPDKSDKLEYLAKLKEVVFEKSEIYAKQNKDSVFTIIEFIFKKTASDFYSLVNNSEIALFDEIFLLSGTILEPRRKGIISSLKSEEYRSKKILLISTQVVEAGVDIDMDLGFKDKSLIDSEEQLAGRINRNVNKSNCKLYIFDCDSEKTLYGGDDRYKLMQEMNSEYQNILENKKFDYLYESVIDKIKKNNHSTMIVNLSDLTNNIATLNYKEVDNSLQIINLQNISVFVPISINTSYLKPFIKELDDFQIPHDDYVFGMDIWRVYESLIEDEDVDFIQNRIKMKKLQGLMSNFTFSIFPNGKDYESLRTFGEEKYGFLYLENYNNIYSFEDGINTEAFNESNFL